MPHTATDVFSVIAEPQRRRILGALADGELGVNHLVDRLGISQPLASKHLRILRSVDLVQVRKHAQQRLYRLNAPALRPVYQWIGSFDRYWQESFDRLDRHLDNIQRRNRHDPNA